MGHMQNMQSTELLSFVPGHLSIRRKLEYLHHLRAKIGIVPMILWQVLPLLVADIILTSL